MKSPIQMAVACGLLALGTAPAYAQSSVTNMVQKITIKFTAYIQLEPDIDTSKDRITRHVQKVSVSNKDIINILGSQMDMGFSSKADLLLLTPAASPDTPVPSLEMRVVVRDVVDGNDVDTDVTELFSLQIVESIEDTTTRLNPYNITGTTYAVISLKMETDEASFEVQGFGKVSLQAVEYAHEPIGKAHTGTFNVSGSGLYSASESGGPSSALLNGTVKLSGRNAEVVTE